MTRWQSFPQTADPGESRVVVLGGEVPSWLAKRSAGDDACDTPGVVDVSIYLVSGGGAR